MVANIVAAVVVTQGAAFAMIIIMAIMTARIAV